MKHLFVLLPILAARASGQLAFDEVDLDTTAFSVSEMTAGDLNLDGVPDLVVSTNTPNRIELRMGLGGGAFAAEAFLEVTGDPDTVVIRDMNGDCLPDLVVASYTDGAIWVHLGDGAGDFALGSVTPLSGTLTISLVVEDFDQDGNADVVAANLGSSFVTFLRGDGQGGFTSVTNLATTQAPRVVSGGDFDNDGWMDFLSVQTNAHNVNVFLNDRQGGFTFSVVSNTGTYPLGVTTGDFNGDGADDFATGATAGPFGQGGRVFLSDGAANFTDVGPSSAIRRILAADFDGDGNVDLLRQSICPACSLTVALGDGTGGFGSLVQVTAGYYVSLADADADGLVDIVTSFDNDPRVAFNRSIPWSSRPNGSWYHGTGMRTSWFEAELTALRYGAHLATVNDAAENDWLLGRFAPDDLFIGYSDFASEGAWVWADGQAPGYENWAGGQPTGAGDFAVITGGTGVWRDEPEDAHYSGLVEIDSADCDANGRPDAFEIAVGWVADANGDGVPDSCTSPIYCTSNPNSTGQAASLGIRGSTNLWANDLEFTTTNAPPNQFGYYLMADTQSYVPLFGGGQGNLCLGLPIVRFAGDILNSGASGDFSFAPDWTALPQNTTVQSGETWNFQLWFRDVNPNATSNTSGAVAVRFTASAGPAVRFGLERKTLVEQTTQFEVSVALSQPTTETVSIPFALSGTATDQIDWRVESINPLTVPAGETCGVLLVTVAGDGDPESTETGVVSLLPPTNAVLADPSTFTLTIVDDD